MADEGTQSGVVTEQGQDPNSTVVIDNAGSQEMDLTKLFGVPNKTKPEPVKPLESTITPAVEKPPVETNTTQTTQPATTQEDFTAKETAYLARIQELESKAVAVEEFEKDPMSFLAKYAGAMVQEKFNPTLYVQNKINEKYSTRDEFGNVQTFVPDPAKVFIPGTPDYNYANDLETFKREADNILNQAGQSINEQREAGIQRFNSAKASVLQKYNLTEDVFNQEIWSVLENVDNGKALELMADGIMLQKKLATMQENIRNGVNRSEVVPSANQVGNGAGANISKEQQEMEKLFGKSAVQRAYN